MSTSESHPARGRVAVVLARHGRPALDRSKSMGWRDYIEWWAAYDAGGLAEDQSPSAALRAVAEDARLVLASPLRRSQETALAVAGEQTVITEHVFVEAALPPPRVPGLRLKPGQWGVFARIAWWFGYRGGLEGRREAEARAEAAVERLLEHVERAETEAGGGDATVLVCAHGWFNRMMRPVLRKRGWRCVRDGGDGYWSFRRYERRG